MVVWDFLWSKPGMRVREDTGHDMDFQCQIGLSNEMLGQTNRTNDHDIFDYCSGIA